MTVADTDGMAASYVAHYRHIIDINGAFLFVLCLVGSILLHIWSAWLPGFVGILIFIVAGAIFFPTRSFRQIAKVKKGRVGIWFNLNQISKQMNRLLIFFIAGVSIGTLFNLIFIDLILHGTIPDYFSLAFILILLGALWIQMILAKDSGTRVRYFRIDVKELDKLVTNGLEKAGHDERCIRITTDSTYGSTINIPQLSVVIYTSPADDNQSRVAISPDGPSGKENIVRIENAISSVAKDI